MDGNDCSLEFVLLCSSIIKKMANGPGLHLVKMVVIMIFICRIFGISACSNALRKS